MARDPAHVTLDAVDACLAALPDGGRLVMHSVCAEPPGLAAALARAVPRLRNAMLDTLMPMAEPCYAGAARPGHLALHTFFPGPGLRPAVAAGRCRVARVPLSAIPGLYAGGARRVDALLLQVSLPGPDGRVSLGVSVDYMPAVLARRPIVIAEMNPAMPRTRGASTLPLTAIDLLVDGGGPVQPFARSTADPVDQRIAAYVAELVADGAVVQAGIGAIPNCVLGLLAARRGLGMHSGIVTEPVMALLEGGTIDAGRRRVVATMAAGSAAFYAYLDDNPQFEFLPCDATHDHATLAAIDGLTAINGALQVDLAGRANAEVVAGRTVSAPGGLPDFARGASAARGGLSIIALRSTSRDGRHSAIVPALPAGAPVTVGAEHVGCVVSEYGVARLAGRSAAQRGRALAAIAHPDFRDGLRRAGA